jgi:hypothetical protein
VIRAAVTEDPGISLTKLRLAVGDDGSGIRKAIEAGAITVHRTGPGKPNRYEVNQAWSGDTGPAAKGGFQRWYEMADFGPDPEGEPRTLYRVLQVFRVTLRLRQIAGAEEP